MKIYGLKGTKEYSFLYQWDCSYFLIYFITCCEDSENLGKIPQPIIEIHRHATRAKKIVTFIS